MLLNINHQSKKPLYIQVYQQFKNKIHTNELKTNERLPSKRQLAEQNSISQNTVMNAYDQLLTEGYIYSKERKGYFVADVKLQYELPTLRSFEEPAAQPSEIKYNLTHSNPDKDLFPFSVFSKLYRKVLNQSPDELLSTTDGQGLSELRASLQHYLSQSRGVPCTANQIILGPSAEYLLSILLQLVEDPTVIGIEDPGYTGFNSLFKRLNKETVPVPLDEMGADIQTLAETNTNLMIVTSNHQFPTGSIMPLSRRQELLEWANQNKHRYIVENDYDSEFKYSGVPIPALKYLDEKNKVIHLGSFTRVLSPGIRISYMVLPETLLEVYHSKFQSQSAPLSTFEQWVIRDFINEGHFTTHLNRSRTFYKKKREFLIQTLYQLDPDAEIYGENAGLHLLVRPSFPFDGVQFKKLAFDAGIKLNLLSDYAFHHQPEDENKVFISFSNISKQEIEKVCKKLHLLAKKCAL